MFNYTFSLNENGTYSYDARLNMSGESKDNLDELDNADLTFHFEAIKDILNSYKRS